MQNFWLRSPLMEEADPDRPGGGGGGDAFDPVKFRTEIMSDVTKMFNGGFTRLEKLMKPKAESEPRPMPEPEPDPQDGDKTDPKVKTLEKKLADALARFEASEKSRTETEAKAKEERRRSLIRAEIAKHSLNPDSVDDAERYFRDEVRYTDDGSLVGGSDEQPLTEFVASVVEKKATWQPPRSVGGAGATAGNRRQPAVDLNDIKPGMKPEDLARVREQLSRVAAEAGWTR